MSRLPPLGPRGEGWVLIQAALIVLAVAAAWSLGPDWTGPLRFIGIGAGIALIVSGLFFIFRGVVDLGGAFTPVPRPRDDAALVETGVYGVVRHPIYSGLVQAAFGGAILQASVAAVALALTLGVVLRLKSGLEEDWLEQRYAGYAVYRKRTPRFFPRLRGSHT